MTENFLFLGFHVRELPRENHVPAQTKPNQMREVTQITPNQRREITQATPSERREIERYKPGKIGQKTLLKVRLSFFRQISCSLRQSSSKMTLLSKTSTPDAYLRESCISLSRATPFGRSRYQTSEFPTELTHITPGGWQESSHVTVNFRP